MPGVSRMGINIARTHLEPLVQKGLSSVLLFGVIETLPKVSQHIFLLCTTIKCVFFFFAIQFSG